MHKITIDLATNSQLVQLALFKETSPTFVPPSFEVAGVLMEAAKKASNPAPLDLPQRA